jgi:hypothetical protein
MAIFFENSASCMRILDAWILDNSKFVVFGIEFDTINIIQSMQS